MVPRSSSETVYGVPLQRFHKSGMNHVHNVLMRGVTKNFYFEYSYTGCGQELDVLTVEVTLIYTVILPIVTLTSLTILSPCFCNDLVLQHYVIQICSIS